MGILKVILIIIGVFFALFVIGMVYLFIPDIRNVTKEPPLQPFVDKLLILKRTAYLFKADKGSYRFSEYVLLSGDRWTGTLVMTVEPGTEIRIREFKIYNDKIGAGFSTLFALGTIKDPEGRNIEFENSIGSVGKSLYDEEAFDLPLTLWQDSTDQNIKIRKK